MMEPFHKKVLAAAFLALGWGIPEAKAASSPASALFQEEAGTAPRDASPVRFLRKRYVRLQTSILEGLSRRFTRPGFDSGFNLNLFPDVQSDWIVDRVWARPGGGWVAWGSLPGTGGKAVLAYRGGVLQADAWIPGHNKIEIRYRGNGLHRVSELDPHPGYSFQGDEDRTNLDVSGWTAQQGVPVQYPQAVQSGCPNSLNLKVGQMMVLYTPLAAQEAGGVTAMEALIDMDWAGMNMAFYNSGVTAQMELAAAQEVNYTETGNVITDLGRLTNPAYFPQLPGLMSTYGAHFVSLFVGSAATITGGGIVAGVGQLPGYATVVYYPYADVAFPHELGHNLGCHHDRQTDGVPSGDGYNYGNRFASGGTTFITIMAYQPGDWILNYSNPDVLFQGQPTGVDPASPIAADNALEINQTFPNTPYTGSNQLPTVQVTSPAGGSYIASLNPLTLTAAASDPDGTVAQVDFYVNDLYVGTAVSAPYTLAWTPPAAGTYYVSATAVDNDGGMKVSCPNEIYVVVPTATVTDTFTDTLTPTLTSTPTPTFTPTVTLTPTSTFTQPFTSTPGSPTSTPTPLSPPPCCAGGNSTINAFAGTGSFGNSGDGGSALQATFETPHGIYCDWLGNLYIADPGAGDVRKVSTTGIITTVAGNGVLGFNNGNGGPATSAGLAAYGVTGDRVGNLYVVEQFYGSDVRKVDTNGIIYAFAGTGTSGYTGDNGPATLATLNFPLAVVADGAGNVYIADSGNNVIRKVDPDGIITTYAGTGTAGYSGDNGPATLAQLNYPVALAGDPAGDLYIGDSGNYRIRKVDANGIITTIAGNGVKGFSGDKGAAINAEITGADGIAFCNGNIYFSDLGNYRIRRVDPGGVLTTVSGNGTTISSGNGGPASLAGVYPYGLAVDGRGNLYDAEPYGLGFGYDGGDVVRKLAVGACAPTATFTRTATATSTPTATLTPTGTVLTSTPTFTASSSPTPTATATFTFTLTPSLSPTFTVTATPTLVGITPTPTPTATPTSQVIGDTFPAFTATSTPTDSPTASPTATGTFTATSTPTPTETPKATMTLTGTSTATSTATLASTVTLTPVPTSPTTPTPTFTSAVTPTGTPIATPTLTASSTGSPNVTLTFTETPTMSLTGTSNETPTGTSTATSTYSPMGPGTDTATPTATPIATFSATPTGPVLFPNPVTGPGGGVRLRIPYGGDVEVDLYTVAFRRVLRKRFPDQPEEVDMELDLTDDRGVPLANGLYYVAVRAAGKKWIGKLLVIR